MNQDALTGVRIKLDRARAHLGDLDAAINAYIKTKPFKVYQTLHFDNEMATEKLRIVRDIPVAWASIIGDTIHNLRGSLDILACELVRHNGRPELIKKTYFPIAASAEKFVQYGLAKISGASPRAIKVVTAIKPYQGGDDLLWQLHQLDIRDKHQALIPVGATVGNISLDVWGRKQKGTVKGTRMVLRPSERIFPLIDGAELDRHRLYESGGQGGMSVDYTFDIAFGEGQVLDGKPVLPTLRTARAGGNRHSRPIVIAT